MTHEKDTATKNRQEKNVTRRFWERWKEVAKKIGDIQARVLLTLFYFFLVGPFALLIRWRGDPLGIRAGHPRGWNHRIDRKGTLMERAIEQF